MRVQTLPYLKTEYGSSKWYHIWAQSKSLKWSSLKIGLCMCFPLSIISSVISYKYLIPPWCWCLPFCFDILSLLHHYLLWQRFWRWLWLVYFLLLWFVPGHVLLLPCWYRWPWWRWSGHVPFLLGWCIFFLQGVLLWHPHFFHMRILHWSLVDYQCWWGCLVLCLCLPRSSCCWLVQLLHLYLLVPHCWLQHLVLHICLLECDCWGHHCCLLCKWWGWLLWGWYELGTRIVWCHVPILMWVIY